MLSSVGTFFETKNVIKDGENQEPTQKRKEEATFEDDPCFASASDPNISDVSGSLSSPISASTKVRGHPAVSHVKAEISLSPPPPPPEGGGKQLNLQIVEDDTKINGSLDSEEKKVTRGKPENINNKTAKGDEKNSDQQINVNPPKKRQSTAAQEKQPKREN